MVTKAHTFNWGILDRQTLFDILYLLKDRIVDHSFTPKQLQDTIVRHVKTYLPIKARMEFDSKVEQGWVYVGGGYYSDYDRDRQTSIELCLAYNQNDKKVIYSSRRFSRLCIAFADTMLHEIIHMRQFRKRKFKDLPGYTSTAQRTKQRQEQEYLGSKDEMDAYSFNIACELFDKFNGNNKEMIRYLNENQKGKNRAHNCWRMYLKAFGHDHNHPIIKRMKKRIIYYFPRSIHGRPFRSADWISR